MLQVNRNRIRNTGLIDDTIRPWRPTMVAGLQWWLAADHVSGVADGGAMSAWNDSSGNGYNLAQGTPAAQPHWQDNIINGKPVVRFDGGDYMSVGNVFSIGDTLTIIVVLRKNITTRATILGQENTTGAFQFEINYGIDGAVGTIINTTFISYGSGATRPANTPNMITYTRNGAGDTHAEYEMGSPIILGTHNTTSFTGNGSKYIGRRGNASQMYVGDIAELMLWSTCLTADQLNDAHVYLAKKYALLNYKGLY
jgi:hypothetical protein